MIKITFFFIFSAFVFVGCDSFESLESEIKGWLEESKKQRELIAKERRQAQKIDEEETDEEDLTEEETEEAFIECYEDCFEQSSKYRVRKCQNDCSEEYGLEMIEDDSNLETTTSG